MSSGLCTGLRVLDLADDPGARAARILGDLGADVVRVVPPEGDPLGRRPANAIAWNAGKRVVELASDDPVLDELLATADVVFDTPHATGLHRLDPARAAGRVGVDHAVRARRTTRGVARDRPRRHGLDREHVLDRPSRPGTGACFRADEPLPHRRRGRVRSAERTCRGSRWSGRRLDAGGRRPREHERAGCVPLRRHARSTARRQHGSSARDLAHQGRLGELRAARRQGARPHVGAAHAAGRRGADSRR